MFDTLVLQKYEVDKVVVLIVSTKNSNDRKRVFLDEINDNMLRVRHTTTSVHITCKNPGYVLCVLPDSSFWDSFYLQGWGHVLAELIRFNDNRGLSCKYCPRDKILRELSTQPPVCITGYGYKCVEILQTIGSGSFALVDRGRIAYIDGMFLSQVFGSRWERGKNTYLLKTTTHMLFRTMMTTEKNRLLSIKPKPSLPRGVFSDDYDVSSSQERIHTSHSLKEVLDHYMEWFVNKDPIY